MAVTELQLCGVSLVLDPDEGAPERVARRIADGIANRMTSPLALVCDSTIDRLHRPAMSDALAKVGLKTQVFVVPEGEATKSLGEAERLVAAWLDAGCDRSTIAVALGGGVVGDLCGFVASIFMRGISYVQVPTTLLAQVDSSVGAKTAVNIGSRKNVAGSFYRPQLVYANLETLSTLSPRDYSAGLAEAVKHGVIADADYLRWIEANLETLKPPADAQARAACAVLVERSCRIKANIVAGDEYEQNADAPGGDGGRARLNFGHTVGHALESRSLALGKPLRHGEAVALGMLAAARVGVALGAGDASLEARLLGIYARVGLPVDLDAWLDAETLAFIKADKKRANEELRFVVVPRIGATGIARVSQHKLEEILLR